MLVFEKSGGAVVNERLFLQELGKLKDWFYEVVRFRKDRSEVQNRYLWVVYGYIADYTGYDVYYIHQAMKQKFLMDHSRSIPVPRSTASLNTTEFIEYVDKIRDFMAPHIYIPSPDERRVANWLPA